MKGVPLGAVSITSAAQPSETSGDPADHKASTLAYSPRSPPVTAPGSLAACVDLQQASP